MTRLIIADDEELIRTGLRLILEREADLAVVGEAATGAEVLRVHRETPADVVLMDLRMPGLDGVEATRRLVDLPERSPRVLVLTTFGSEELVYAALKAGASGFLLKTTAPVRLVEGVRAVSAGESLLSPEITSALIERYVSGPSPTPGRPAELAALTEREVDVLRAVGQGRSNQELATELFLSDATAKTYVTRILAKLGLRDRAQAAILAYETGLVRPGGGERR